jgi:hypothetical protein
VVASAESEGERVGRKELEAGAGDVASERLATPRPICGQLKFN